MKIAHVLGVLNFGGVESTALRLIRGLAPPSYSHIVINTSTSPTDERAPEFAALVPIVYCPYRPGKRAGFMFRCWRLFREVRPDAVIAYSFGNHAMIAVAARLAGVRTVFVRVASDPLFNRKSVRKNALLAHLARPFCDGEIATSESTRDGLVRGLRLPASRVWVVRNGCEVRAIRECVERLRQQAAPAPSPLLLMVSRMDDAKDHPTLLRAIARLCQEGFPIKALFVGDGPARKDHEQMAEQLGIGDSVRFPGSQPDVVSFLAQADVLVHATRTEGFGIVLIEAMAARVPVVASDVPSCRRILDGGRCGVLVPAGDDQHMARSIRQLLEDVNFRASLVDAAFARVQALYDISDCVSRYEALLTRRTPARIGEEQP